MKLQKAELNEREDVSCFGEVVLLGAANVVCNYER